MPLRYTHKDGGACQANGVTIPSREAGGLLQGRPHANLDKLVKAGILKVENISQELFDKFHTDRMKAAQTAQTAAVVNKPATASVATAAQGVIVKIEKTYDELKAMALADLRAIASTVGVVGRSAIEILDKLVSSGHIAAPPAPLATAIPVSTVVSVTK